MRTAMTLDGIYSDTTVLTGAVLPVSVKCGVGHLRTFRDIAVEDQETIL
jgi:hypothetical protein